MSWQVAWRAGLSPELGQERGAGSRTDRLLPRLHVYHIALPSSQPLLHHWRCLPVCRDGGPWMELSIKTYYADPAHPWQTRQYRVHATSLQPEQPPAPEAEPPAGAAGGEGAAAAECAGAAAEGS